MIPSSHVLLLGLLQFTIGLVGLLLRRPGMVVVGIENTWVVTAQGMKKLNRFPDTIFECC